MSKETDKHQKKNTSKKQVWNSICSLCSHSGWLTMSDVANCNVCEDGDFFVDRLAHRKQMRKLIKMSNFKNGGYIMCIENNQRDLSIELREIDFSKEFSERKKICYISGRPEKAVTPYVNLYSAAKLTGCDKLEKLYFKPDLDENGCNGAVVYEDYGFVCKQICHVSKFDTLQQIVERLTQYECKTYLGYKNQIEVNMKNGGYVNLCNIRIAELIGEESSYIQKLVDYRLAYIAAQDEKQHKLKIAEQQANAEFVAQKQSEAQARISEMEREIRNDALIVNSSVEVYTSRYNHSDKRVLLLLMRKYGIDVPLRTQGWINTNLFSFKIDADRNVCGYSYKHSKSTVISKYLQLLISAVCREEVD